MPFDGRDLRNALGQFATGVCVITTTTGEQRPIGMTVNSFAAVSLEPPLVLWSLQNNSEVYREYAKATHFNINVLSSEQRELSNYYARKGCHQLKPEHYCQGTYGGPIILDTLVTFECELDVSHPGGDHLIIIGRIKNMTNLASGKPLLFYSGAYCKLC